MLSSTCLFSAGKPFAFQVHKFIHTLVRGEPSRESVCHQCPFTALTGNLKTTKTDKKNGSQQESHPLSDRPEIEWPCRT